jgi:tRNA threonylcarbamoyladenosine biosynthesis protein TsaE
MNETIITSSAQNTREIGKALAKRLKGGEIIALYGDLGAGKTTFTSGIIGYFIPKKRVLSPTFNIVRHYKIKHPNILHLYHVDLYRLTDPNQIHLLGLWDYVGRSDTVFIFEWPKLIEPLLPKDRIGIQFNPVADEKRELTISYDAIK